MKNKTLIVAIIVFLLAAFGIWYALRQQINPGTANTTQQVTTTPTVPPDTETQQPHNVPQLESHGATVTYHNRATTHDGFDVTFPTTLVVDHANITGLALHFVNAFLQGTNLKKTAITVGTSSLTQAQCEHALAQASHTEKVTVNGTQFTKMSLLDCGAGQCGNEIMYTTYHQNTCYSLDLTYLYSNIANFDPKLKIKAFDEKTIKSVFDTIVQSFVIVPQH